MLREIKKLSNEFLEEIKHKKNNITVISHYDTDGITSAAIFSFVLQRLNKHFSLKIIKQLEKSFIKSLHNLPQDQLLIFLDLGSGEIELLNQLKNEIYILDHHEINKDIKLEKNIKILNPHLYDEEDLSGSCLTYLFAKEISDENKDLANLAVVGMVGDMLDKNLGKLGNSIINDAEMIIKKGLLFYPATRPLNKALEFSSGIFIPGVTGSSAGAINLLREAGIERKEGRYKSLMELDKEEMSNLITAIILRRNKKNIEEVIGKIYLVKFYTHLEDTRELSAMINACSRLENSHVALSLCLGNKEARKKAEKIYAKYKQHLIAGLNFVSNLEKIEGQDYVIINAENNIKDTIIGTIASILSMSSFYKQGTAIIAMAHDQEKIKVSARIAGRRSGDNGESKNIREVLESVTKEIGGQSGGHALAAGCIISREKEKDFIDVLKKKLEFELVKI